MFRIGLDLRGTEAGFKAHYGRGTWRYVSELEKALFSKSQDSLEFVKLYRGDLSASPLQQTLLKTAPFGRQTLESQLFLPSRLKKLDVDVVHFFAHVDAPSFSSQILTVLDLIPLKFKDLYTVSKGKWRFALARSLENIAIKNARGIITISECSKRDIVEILKVPEEKIFVTPLAVSGEFTPRLLSRDTWIEDQNKEREHFGLPKDKSLILYVGGIDARKNLGFFLEVFSKFSGDAELLLAGSYKNDKDFPALEKKIEDLGIKNRVRLLGFIKDQDLPRLYRASTCSVFPSLYEGFGLPVLESLATGTPVLAGDNSSIPEVVGSDYPLLEDKNHDLWLSKLKELLGNLDCQMDLASKGLERVRLFSWEETARRTIDAYSKIGGLS